MLRDSTPDLDPQAIALAALGWLLADDDRASRLLDVTGLTPDTLRQGIADPALLIAVIEYLGTHEPDLIACAEAIGVTPDQLIAARLELMR